VKKSIHLIYEGSNYIYVIPSEEQRNVRREFESVKTDFNHQRALSESMTARLANLTNEVDLLRRRMETSGQLQLGSRVSSPHPPHPSPPPPSLYDEVQNDGIKTGLKLSMS